MANAKLTRDVKVLSTGFSRNAGRAIGQGEVSPAIWRMWVAEGIVVYSGTPPPLPELDTKNDEVTAPPVTSLPKDEIEDEQLQKLSFTELKAMGKKMKLTSWHLMHRDTLLRKIQEQS